MKTKNDTDFRVAQLGKDDALIAQQLFMILQEVFEAKSVYKAGESYIKKLLENPAFIVFAAFDQNEPVGGLTAYQLPMYNSEIFEIYLYDIGVKQSHQRKGIGKQLLSAIKAYRHENGAGSIFVQANEADQHAIDFYRSAGAIGEKVIQFTLDIQ